MAPAVGDLDLARAVGSGAVIWAMIRKTRDLRLRIRPEKENPEKSQCRLRSHTDHLVYFVRGLYAIVPYSIVLFGTANSVFSQIDTILVRSYHTGTRLLHCVLLIRMNSCFHKP